MNFPFLSRKGEPFTTLRMESSVSQAGTRNTVNDPVHWPLRNVLVKEREDGNQTVLRGIPEEEDKYVWLVVEGDVFGVTTFNEGWDTLVVAEADGK